MADSGAQLAEHLDRLILQIDAGQRAARALRQRSTEHRAGLRSAAALAGLAPLAAERPQVSAPPPDAPSWLIDLVTEAEARGSRTVVLALNGRLPSALLGSPALGFSDTVLESSDRGPDVSTPAIANLESLRAQGASRLIIPPGAEPWLGPRGAFRRHLGTRYRKLDVRDGFGVWALDYDPAGKRPWGAHLQDLLDEYRLRYAAPPAILDWQTELKLTGRVPESIVFEPPTDDERLPYLDDSVELVFVDGAGATATAAPAEARRVARDALVLGASAGRGRPFEVEWLSEPRYPTATVSVVVPTFDAAPLLETCLRSLHETLPRALAVEVVVVDDASSDDTGKVLEKWSNQLDRLTVVRNEHNAGFLDSCNLGAEAAAGDLLVFLNNDTIPLAGWLVPLAETLVHRPDVGAVGGKLLYPDGRLQEAGGVIFSDASGANFGRGDRNPDAPLYQFVRPVHYCSGALLAVRSSEFRELGGFDPEFRPGYYEETDLCFRLRERGLSVVYHPEAAVVHLEGATAGTEQSTGMKRYQAVNRERFARHWAEVLERHPLPPVGWDDGVWYRLSRVDSS